MCHACPIRGQGSAIESRLSPPDNPAHGRIMQAGRNGHLGLGVSEFEARLDNCLVAILPARSVRQQVLQAGAVGEALDARDFLEDALFLEHGKQLFEKRIVTEEALPFEIVPGRDQGVFSNLLSNNLFVKMQEEKLYDYFSLLRN